ncbi:MAG: hypothetical protein GYB68_08185 [Chloroflexi bacterium]|nr:hypothetical protein [Chloroflexota bacterium]
MKVSIWQQFSSNHSADFTVIGTFQSVDLAQKAEAELRAILAEILDWRENPVNQLEGVDQEGWAGQPVTAIEQEIAQRYGVRWSRLALDWFASRRDIDAAVQRLGSTVFVTSQIETWLGQEPFDALLESLGAQVGTIGEASANTAKVHLTAVAPDESTAAAVADAVRRYQLNAIHAAPPWLELPDLVQITLATGEIVTLSREKVLDLLDWQAELQQREQQAAAAFMQSEGYQQIMSEIQEAQLSGETEQVRALMDQLQELRQAFGDANLIHTVRSSTSEEERRRAQIASSLGLMVMYRREGAGFGLIEREGTQLRLASIHFHWIAYGLPALISYLERLGFTEIDYQIKLSSSS